MFPSGFAGQGNGNNSNAGANGSLNALLMGHGSNAYQQRPPPPSTPPPKHHLPPTYLQVLFLSKCFLFSNLQIEFHIYFYIFSQTVIQCLVQ